MSQPVTDPRDWSESEYVRIYQTLRDDPKYAEVYPDDRALAAYVRLLMDAEPVYPNRASVPAHLRPYARKVLVDAGILLVEGGRYTLSGLAKERQGRVARFGKDGTGRPRYKSDDPLRNHSESGITNPPTSEATYAGASVSSSFSESSSTEGGPGGNPTDDLDGPLAYYEVTTRYPQPQSELHAWVTTLAVGYTAPVFQKALAAEFMKDHKLNDLVSRTEARLAMEADRNRKASGPVRFDRKAWIEQKRREQEERDGDA